MIEFIKSTRGKVIIFIVVEFLDYSLDFRKSKRRIRGKPAWRNWHTRWIQNPLSEKKLQVRVLSPVLEKRCLKKNMMK